MVKKGDSGRWETGKIQTQKKSQTTQIQQNQTKKARDLVCKCNQDNVAKTEAGLKKWGTRNDR